MILEVGALRKGRQAAGNEAHSYPPDVLCRCGPYGSFSAAKYIRSHDFLLGMMREMAISDKLRIQSIIFNAIPLY